MLTKCPTSRTGSALRVGHITIILSGCLSQTLTAELLPELIFSLGLPSSSYFPTLFRFLCHRICWILIDRKERMSHHGALDLDRHSSLERSRRSTGRGQPRDQAKPGDVFCDFCTTRRQKAEKSCLVCLASYCETHLQAHYEYPALMKHKLVKATGQMREKLCAQHDKLLEAFCRADQTSVCVLCMMDEHKHHDIVPAGTERTEKQVGLPAFTLIKMPNQRHRRPSTRRRMSVG